MNAGPGRLSVLHLLTHAKINAGGSIQAFLLAREFARRGHAVTMAFTERHGEADPDTRARVEAIGCAYAGVPPRGWKGRRALKELLRGAGYDVVHLHREQALEQFLRVGGAPERTAVIANVGTSKPPDDAQARRLADRRIDRVVTVAAALKALLVAAAGLDPCRIEAVPGAFDEEAFRVDAPPLDREKDLGVPANSRVVGMVANLDPKKGHRVFLEAASRVHARRGDVVFVCAGKGDAEPLRARAAELGLPAERLRMLGFWRDVPALLRALDLSVSASTKGEGMTGAIRESLAMGCPVVCTALAGNPEIVRHGETGLLVPVNDPQALADAILDSLADPGAARARASRGREYVRATLTSAARAERMESLYRDAVHWRRVRLLPLERILHPSPAPPPAAGSAG